ncbi:Ig-like domain-containing protein, partial [Candidatus Nomurabacteria bacterium]|nr:Ig-like domain-containing protein [Candidatus Nomurabacteria bacterium]
MMPPTATNLSAAETYTVNTPLDLINIVVSDVDSASVTATLTLSNIAAGALNTGTSGAVTSTYNAGTGVWTASGALASVNTLLAGLTFTPATNFSSSFTIATSVSDGIASSLTGSKSMKSLAANTAPVLDTSKTPTLGTIAENAPAPSGAVGLLVSTLVDFTIPSGGLDNVTDTDSGANTGIAVVAVESGGLTCFYSTNSGGTWNSLGTPSGSAARLLAANAATRVYCRAGTGITGVFSSAITFRAWDQTSGTNGGVADVSLNGGTTAFSVATDTAGFTVGTPPVDSTPPTVESVSPADGAIGTGIDAPIVITFSEAMDPDSLDLSISPCGLAESDECAPYDAAWSEGNTVLTLTLTNGSFDAQTEYTLTIEAVTDEAGNNLGAYSSSFTTYIPLVLTEVAQIPAQVKARDAIYHFSTNEAAAATGESSYFSSVCSDEDDDVVVVIDPDVHTYTLSHLTVGRTYECSFNLQSMLRGTSNTLSVGPFKVISSASSSSGGRVGTIAPVSTVASSAPSPLLGTPGVCSAAQILTQNLHAPSRNGYYSKYTGAVVKEVKILQAHLNRLGFSSGPEDGILGPLSDGAIKRMQTFSGTKADGYVGPITREFINNS